MKSTRMKVVNAVLVVAMLFQPVAYSGTKITAATDFSTFADNISIVQRISLAQSADMFPKIKRSDFGQYGLESRDHYVRSPRNACKERPLRPRNFNQVCPSIVKNAIEKGRIDENFFSSERVQQRVYRLRHHVWNRYNGDFDYHSKVQWVAEKRGVDTEHINKLSTFELERKVVEVFFAEIWDELSEAQRIELLEEIEAETGSSIPDKAAIATMGGSAAVVALSSTVAFTGFAFYTTMSVVLSTVAGWFGVVLPFAVYKTASIVVAVLSGPVGWAIAIGLAAASVTAFGWPSVDSVEQVVLTRHFIEAESEYGEAIEAF